MSVVFSSWIAASTNMMSAMMMMRRRRRSGRRIRRTTTRMMMTMVMANAMAMKVTMTMAMTTASVWIVYSHCSCDVCLDPLLACWVVTKPRLSGLAGIAGRVGLQIGTSFLVLLQEALCRNAQTKTATSGSEQTSSRVHQDGPAGAKVLHPFLDALDMAQDTQRCAFVSESSCIMLPKARSSAILSYVWPS